MLTRSILLLAGCVVSLLVVSAVSLQLGAIPLQTAQLLDILFRHADPALSFVVWDLRLPRLLVALLAGAALGASGAVIQTMTRNPLASPGLMGITPGVALSMVIAIVAFNLTLLEQLLAGVLGGIASGLLLFLMSARQRLQPVHLTLIGLSISLFASAGIMALLVLASSEANGLYFWLTGSLINRTWAHVEMIALIVPVSLLICWLCARPLNLMNMDDDQCQALGMPLLRWRLILGLLVVLMVAGTVAITGPIGFVGLAAPHAVRLLLQQPFGASDHRLLIPFSALLGATMLTMADIVARDSEIPVGIVAAFVGGPLFILLIGQQGRRYAR